MSRRSQVVRTQETSGPPTPRSFSAVTILCDVSGSQELDDETDVCVIPLGAARDYQRIFVSATIDRLTGTTE